MGTGLYLNKSRAKKVKGPKHPSQVADTAAAQKPPEVNPEWQSVTWFSFCVMCFVYDVVEGQEQHNLRFDFIKEFPSVAKELKNDYKLASKKIVELAYIHAVKKQRNITENLYQCGQEHVLIACGLKIHQRTVPLVDEDDAYQANDSREALQVCNSLSYGMKLR
jgi:hypothetical protein